jgi:hypothetical protein
LAGQNPRGLQRSAIDHGKALISHRQITETRFKKRLIEITLALTPMPKTDPFRRRLGEDPPEVEYMRELEKEEAYLRATPGKQRSVRLALIAAVRELYQRGLT